MKTILKDVAQSILRRYGFELKRINPNAESPLPKWIADSEPESIVDEVISQGWIYNVLHMANKNYTSPRLSYKNTVWRRYSD